MTYQEEKNKIESDLKARRLRLKIMTDEFNRLQKIAQELAFLNIKDEVRVKELNSLIEIEKPTYKNHVRLARALGLLFLMIPSFLFAQVQIDFGAGAARLNEGLPTETGSRNLFYTLNISAAYKVNNVVIGGDFIPEFGGSVTNTPSYYGLKAGYSIGSITPTVGYYRAFISSDNPELNKYVVGYSLDYYYEMGEPGGIFGRAMYINNSFIAAVGCRINIK